jgi:hypothetical protein
MMTKDTETIKEIMLEALAQHHDIFIDDHADHHEWIKDRIAAEKAKEEYYKEAKKTIIGWSITALASYALYFIQSHWKING